MSGPGILPTLLPIARYAEIMHIPLTHFHQLGGAKAPIGTCDDLWDQDAREALVWAILQAEQKIADYLGFQVAPKFITDEQVMVGWQGARGDWENAEVRTEFGYIDCFGIEQLTLVHADAVVSYTNHDGDPLGREELATIEGGVYGELGACAKECDVAVFFRLVDGAIDPADPRFEIRPLKVDIDGSTMTITGESSLFVKPELWNLTQADCFGSGEQDWRYDFDLGNLVDRVDVYCRTINKQTPVSLRWDGRCACAGACAHSTQTGCAYITDKRLGFFSSRPASWNGTTNVWANPLYSDPPESVRVNYRAGYPLSYCRMNADLERAVVKLTNALLPEPPCGYCDLALRLWNLDRQKIDPLTVEAANMPWDSYFMGALEAWRIVKRMGFGEGGKLGH